MIVCNCTLSIINFMLPNQYVSSLEFFLSVVSMRNVHPEHPPGFAPILTNVVDASSCLFIFFIGSMYKIICIVEEFVLEIFFIFAFFLDYFVLFFA